ncbi:Helitron helicase-like protein [Phytophthora palmivora]|uniref:Helitron helicase-like protein n=1 Tax=Phytophthora palmivora TaxID=4796 RepID=A0A2P4YQR3_9STRA|nr:Helitron helicase-like protein [Phytophthora palmivora]
MQRLRSFRIWSGEEIERNPEGTADLLYKDVPVKYRWDDRLSRLKHWIRCFAGTSRHKTQSGFTLDFYCAIGDHPNRSKIFAQ